jgi:hypothetical protein
MPLPSQGRMQSISGGAPWAPTPPLAPEAGDQQILALCNSSKRLGKEVTQLHKGEK